jgi:hypothetical protein
MVWGKVWTWIGSMFSENGQPSSARVISAWLSVSSMSLIWWIFHHMMQQPVDKLAVWMGNLPMVIGALASFAVAPYGVNRLSTMFKKDEHYDGHKEDAVDDPDKK